MSDFRIKLRIFTILIACTFLIGWIDPASDKNEEGINLYNEKKYDEAIGKFTDAQLHNQESESLKFNIANTHYRKGKFPEAEKSFKDATKTKDISMQAKANYNMGNTMYKQGKFTEALDFYKRAIELTEEKSGIRGKEIEGIREDAKYNYEFVQKKIEEMKKEQQERQEQEKQEQKEQEKQEQKKQEKQKDEEQDKKDEEKEENRKRQDSQNKKNEQEKESPQENKIKEPPPLPREKGEMTKEEAERILDALKHAEMSARDKQEKERKSAHFNIEKDW
ncbi:MAG: tetratricopeptide repeat protein [Candidatus Scalinduaceae bacterium]